jgi:hypothetical protein
MEANVSVTSSMRKTFETHVIVFFSYQGVHFFHTSCWGCHGRLSDTNCLVDGRWLLKLTDYGLPHLMEQVAREESYDGFKGKRCCGEEQKIMWSFLDRIFVIHCA